MVLSQQATLNDGTFPESKKEKPNISWHKRFKIYPHALLWQALIKKRRVIGDYGYKGEPKKYQLLDLGIQWKSKISFSQKIGKPLTRESKLVFNKLLQFGQKK